MDTGASDPLFNPGTGPTVAPNGWLSSLRSALALQADGKILCGSLFDHYNGTARSDLVRLTDSNLNFTAVSRKAHGDIAAFDIALPSTGASGVECRTGGTDRSYKLLFTFPAAMTFTDASIAATSGTVAATSGSGTTTATVDLIGVENMQAITVTLRGVTTDQSTADISVPLRLLIGDTNGDGVVNSGDAIQTRSRSGQAVTDATFRSDVNADGMINSGDAIVVRARSGTAVP